MSRSHHNVYSQQHHTHQNSWFMSPNVVNSLFCSPGNSSSANCNNNFFSSSNMNSHLSSLLNAQHHFIPSNQLSSSHSFSNSQSSIINGNTFSSHYAGGPQNFTSRPYSSIFPMNNAYSNFSTGSNKPFIAGQNNHHYQSSSNYSRSMHSNRTSKGIVNCNSIMSEGNHSRRYQPGFNSFGPLITYPNSTENAKSMNISSDFNVFNDNSARSLSSHPVFYQKDSKSPNHTSFHSQSKYNNTWSKISSNESDSLSESLSSSDFHQHPKPGNTNTQVRGMENIKLDNEGVHSNYLQFNEIGCPSVSNNYEANNESKISDLSSNIKENVNRINSCNQKVNVVKIRNSSLDDCKISSDPEKSKRIPNTKKIDGGSFENQNRSSAKFLLNIDEEFMYYNDDIVTEFEPDSKIKQPTGLKDEQSSPHNFTKNSRDLTENLSLEKEEKDPEIIDEAENESVPDIYEKKSFNKTNNQSTNVPDLGGAIQRRISSRADTMTQESYPNMDFINSEVNVQQQPTISSFSPNNSHFSANNLLSAIPSSNIATYPPHIVPNFGMNCPLLSNPGHNIMAAAYIAAALGVNNQSVMSNPKYDVFHLNNFSNNSANYHDVVSTKLWQYYSANRQTEVMYVRKVQLRNALHMVMSYVFENAGLFIVGSSMNGFGNDHSDMDLCLTISSKELHQKKEAFVVLNQLVEPLRKCSFIKNLQLIRATVPILKFRDVLAGVDCDLNINNVVGIYNTHLLAMYNRIDWRVRPLGMYIKHWAQKLDLHDASRGRLSTYTLILMIIQYLQSGCQPPILPSLQAKFSKHFSYDRQVKEVDMRLELPWEKLRSVNTAKLSDLLMGFFEYYVEKFDFSRMAVSVRTGKPIPIEMAIKQLPPHEQLHNVKSFKMFIEEPFSLTNVARSLFDNLVFSRIKQCFRHSLQVMRTKQSLKCMFSLPTQSNPVIKKLASSNQENIDKNRMTNNTSPTTSNSTQEDNSKNVAISDNIDNDIFEKSYFKDDGSSSDDNKSFDKIVISNFDFDEDDDVSISGLNK